jgi:hypothetical protein
MRAFLQLTFTTLCLILCATCEGDTLVGRHIFVDQQGPGVVDAFHRQYGFGALSHTVSFSTGSTEASTVSSVNREATQAVKLRRNDAKHLDRRPWCAQIVCVVFMSHPPRLSKMRDSRMIREDGVQRERRTKETVLSSGVLPCQLNGTGDFRTTFVELTSTEFVLRFALVRIRVIQP